MPGGSVRIRATGAGPDRRAGFAGLMICGSVWSCPVCSAKILFHRQGEVEAALAAWSARGGRLAMVTLTMRHDRGQSLSLLWDALSAAWRAVVTGRAWARARKDFDVGGYVRAVEVTHGAAGWHVHVHVGVFIRRDVTGREVDDLGCAMFQPWRASLLRSGLAAPLARHGGLDAVLWDGRSQVLSTYFTKNTYSADASSAALELARGDLKAARAGNRTPFRILSDVAAYGLADDVALWQEWERASKGRRQMTWSKGLRQELALDAEATDDELAALEEGTADDDLVEIPAAAWRFVCRSGMRALLVEIAESDETGHALRRYLAGRGIEYRDVGAFVG